MSGTWIGLRCASGRPDICVAEADMPVAERRNHGLTHAVGGAQTKLLLLLVEHIDRAGLGVGELHRLERRWW